MLCITGREGFAARATRACNRKAPNHPRAPDSTDMNSLIWFAIALIILWVVVRVFLAVTSAVLHLVWIVAIILFVVWLVRKFTS